VSDFSNRLDPNPLTKEQIERALLALDKAARDGTPVRIVNPDVDMTPGEPYTVHVEATKHEHDFCRAVFRRDDESRRVLDLLCKCGASIDDPNEEQEEGK
jgi:hypothetical protein